MAERIQAKDLRGQRRERLIDAVPLPAPWTMFIEPTNACNYRCSYCPTGNTALLKQVGRKNTLMSYEDFCSLVDDMTAFPRKLKMVNMYKDGESLLHPRFCDMVRYLRESGATERIWLKTNGHLLEPKLNAELVKCGLDMIGISVQGVNAQQFMDISQAKVNYEQYRANIADLYHRRRSVAISIKVADYGQSDADKEKFYADFKDRCDFITIEGLHGWSASDKQDWRLGTDQSFDGSPRSNKIACPLVLYMLTVSSNGDVSICNDDWMHAHSIGNVHTESLMQIWHGEKLRAFRLMHLEGRRSENAACGTCDYLAALPDNIDADRETFAERLR